MSKMNKEQIFDTIRTLANSQGFYGGVLEVLENNTEEERDKFLSYLEAQDLYDAVDLVEFLEG